MMTVEEAAPRKKVQRRRRCLELNVNLLFFFGFWPENGNDVRNAWFYWRYLFPRIQVFRQVYSLVFQAINVYLVWGDIARVVEYFTMILLYTMVLVKCSTLFFNREKLRKMVARLRALNTSKNMMSNTFLKTSMNTTDQFSHNFTAFFLVFMIPAFILNAIFLIFQGFASGEIPFRYWLPYNYDIKFVFEALIITMIAMIFDLCILLICDLMFVGMTIHINGQFKVLNHKFQYIRHNVETIRGRPKVTDLSLNTSHARVTMAQQGRKQTTATDEPKNYNLTLNKDVDRNVKTPLHSRNIVLNRTVPKKRNVAVENAMNEDMEDYLRKCVKHHQILIGFNNDLCSIYKFVLIVQVLINLACGVVALYITTLAKSVDFKVTVSLFLVLASYLETLIFCWFGNLITEESQNVLNCVYGCDWFGESESFKRSIRIIISRSNRPLILRAAGLPLSMRTFRTIYKTAYYIHMISTRIFHGIKISRKSS